ncbi:type II toxin-antitoxin system HicA family toxin [Lactobacillus xujianguonis]|uniref:Type II toxin-antitoxin system HicA family toxin n=1 Tax=Lactobacillus xujianguonis TaxID=2495899 RepID=A0A437SU36_9LACO|nr:type II toxin-antitoxin system HicA family toxin [Lactobacillus xujianguonis]RVU70416.1 type II toxin-antitoxin system HicA family toxin [Lactobacillus xujianguonis]
MTQYLVKDILKRLKHANFVEIRIAGDHHIFRNMKNGKMLVIPYARRKDTIAVGTAHAIIRVIEECEK